MQMYGYVQDPLMWVDPWGLSAASDLAQLKGKSVPQINQMLSDAGFTLDRQTSTGNQTWSHIDGSMARVDPYGNQSMTMRSGDPLPKSGANAHVHKYDPGRVALNDRGIPVSPYSSEAHIGIKNPDDYPTKRGRPHGCGA
jgi:hypothetical protein